MTAARAAVALVALMVLARDLRAQHCLGIGSAPVASGFARASAWAGEHQYARRNGVGLAVPLKRLVGSLSYERIYDQEFAATVNNVGVALVADVPVHRSNRLWICPALGVESVLGPKDFTAVDDTRSATDVAAGLGVAVAIDATEHVRVVPSVSALRIGTWEKWTNFFEPDRRRRGAFTEIHAGVQFILNGDAALALLAQVPIVEADERTFPFWRSRDEIAWQVIFSFQIPLNARASSR